MAASLLPPLLLVLLRSALLLPRGSAAGGRLPTQLEQRVLEAALRDAPPPEAASAPEGAAARQQNCSAIAVAVPPLHADAQEYEFCVGGPRLALFRRRGPAAAEADAVSGDVEGASATPAESATAADDVGNALGVTWFDALAPMRVAWVQTPIARRLHSAIISTYTHAAQSQPEAPDSTSSTAAAAIGVHYCDPLEPSLRLVAVDFENATDEDGMLAQAASSSELTCSASSAQATMNGDASASCSAGAWKSTNVPRNGAVLRAWIAAPLLCLHRQFSHPDVIRLESVLDDVYSKYQGRVYDTTQGSAATYGELSTRGFLQMLDGLPEEHQVKASSVFVDVGSGLGKLALAATLLTPAARARGIEVVPGRAAAASEAFAEASSKGLLSAPEVKRLELFEGDAFGDRSAEVFAKATHVFCNSLTFDEASGRKLVESMLRLGHSLSCFMSSKRFDVAALAAELAVDAKLATISASDDHSAKNASAFAEPCLQWRKSARVEMSWSKATTVHYYCCDRKSSVKGLR